jgi:hypothetical protein
MSEKKALFDALVVQVEAQLSALIRRQQDTAAGATHEESRSEHAKDTRATEQSYLARGLAERVEESRRTVAALKHLPLLRFEAGDPIATTALVTLEIETETGTGTTKTERWFVVPGAGGIELDGTESGQTRTVTPVSPLGKSLLGLSSGDEGEVRTPGGRRAFEVTEVS